MRQSGSNLRELTRIQKSLRTIGRASHWATTFKLEKPVFIFCTREIPINRMSSYVFSFLLKRRGISNYDGSNATMLRRILVRSIHYIIPERISMEPQPETPQIDSSKAFQGVDILINEKLDYEIAKFIALLKSKNGEPVNIK